MSKDLLKRTKAVAGGDPDPQEVEPLVVSQARKIKITAGELRDAVRGNPDHPISKVYSKAVRGFPNNRQVVVDAVDLQAVLENGTVEVGEQVETLPDDGTGETARIRKRTKQFKAGKPTPSPAPATPPKK